MATAGRKQTAAKTKVRRKEKKNIVAGQAHIKSTFNNTIISITDPTGAVIACRVGRTPGDGARAQARRGVREGPGFGP